MCSNFTTSPTTDSSTNCCKSTKPFRNWLHHAVARKFYQANIKKNKSHQLRHNSNLCTTKLKAHAKSVSPICSSSTTLITAHTITIQMNRSPTTTMSSALIYTNYNPSFNCSKYRLVNTDLFNFSHTQPITNFLSSIFIFDSYNTNIHQPTVNKKILKSLTQPPQLHPTHFRGDCNPCNRPS